MICVIIIELELSKYKQLFTNILIVKYNRLIERYKKLKLYYNKCFYI